MKTKSNHKHRSMHGDRELTENESRIKNKFRESFSAEDYLPFSFQGTPFPKT